MSKKNKDLAVKIIDQLGVVENSESGEGYIVNLSNTVLPYQAMPWGKTQKAAKANAVGYIADELDTGSLTLSDTWAEDNL